MKHIFIFLVSTIIFSPVLGQDQSTEDAGAAIKWENPSYDFGDIKQGERVETTFKFENSGNAPLIITNVEVTCGCTTPKGWPRDPILPGGKGEITVAFNSTGKYGRQNKVVKIISNSISPQNQIVFTVNVLPKEQN